MTTTTPVFNQHGDVLLRLRDKLPENATLETRTHQNRVLLSETSKQTGHEHKINAKTGTADIYTLNEGAVTRRYLVAAAPVEVTGHPDHADITLDAGVYELKIAREVDPVEGIRAVQD